MALELSSFGFAVDKIQMLQNAVRLLAMVLWVQELLLYYIR